MKKLTKILSTAVLVGTLAGCSSSAAAAKASSSSASGVDHTYSEQADVTKLTFAETTFHSMTVSVPNEWSGRKNSNYDEMDYTIKGSKDVMEFLYVGGATASEDLFKTIKTNEKWTAVSTEKKELNGTEAYYAKGISVIYNVIQEDANSQMYLIQDGTGVTAIIMIQDPEGTVDMTPVFDKVLSSVKMK